MEEMICRVLIAVMRAFVRLIIMFIALFVLSGTLGASHYVLYEFEMFPSQFDPEVVACAVDGDHFACRRLR